VGGLAHYLEEEGLATTQISIIREHTVTIKPPRALWVPFDLGRPLGEPNDAGFQTRVLTAAFALLDEKEGPVLKDFPEEAAYMADQGPWACPVNLSAPGEDLSEEGELMAAFKIEMNQLRNWYDIAVEKRGRTTVGVSGVELDDLADFISAFLNKELPENPNPDYLLPHTLNLATDDLKAFYTEAVTAQPGSTGTPDQLADWFYGRTAAGRLLYAIRDKGVQSEDGFLRIVAGALIIPSTKPRPPAS
jgi:hypothetical protein